MEPVEKKVEAPPKQPEVMAASPLKPGEDAVAAADRQAEEFRAKGPEVIKPGTDKLAKTLDKARAEGWQVA